MLIILTFSVKIISNPVSLSEFAINIKDQETGENKKWYVINLANIDSIIHNNKASYIKDLRPNIGYRVIGAFIDCKEILTKKNELMLVGSISDGSNEINVVIFPNDYIKIKPIIRLNKLYKIDGKTRFDNERQRLQLIINDAYKC